MNKIVERSANLASAWWIERLREENLRWRRDASQHNGHAPRPSLSEESLAALGSEIANCVRETHPDAWCIDLTVSSSDPLPTATMGDELPVVLSKVLARAAKVSRIMPVHFPIGSSMIIGGDGLITVRCEAGDPLQILSAAR